MNEIHKYRCCGKYGKKATLKFHSIKLLPKLNIQFKTHSICVCIHMSNSMHFFLINLIKKKPLLLVVAMK